jgi:hypothetical protein
MGRLAVLVLAVLLAAAVPRPAAAKLPFLSVDVAPRSPAVGERMVVTMRCWRDPEHTRAWPSCLGAGGTMAWVHPLDSEGRLDRHDWLVVTGFEGRSGATVGSFTLAEPGPYLLTPLWRDWRRGGRGFPDAIRFHVDGDPSRLPIAVVAALAVLVADVARRRWRRGTGKTTRRRQRPAIVLRDAPQSGEERCAQAVPNKARDQDPKQRARGRSNQRKDGGAHRTSVGELAVLDQ